MRIIRVLPSAALIGTFFVMAPIAPAFADYTVRVCMGEDQANGCPVSHDAMYGCGVTVDQAAAEVCSVTTNGQSKVLPYSKLHEGSHSGGHCGYEWYRVTCHSG